MNPEHQENFRKSMIIDNMELSSSVADKTSLLQLINYLDVATIEQDFELKFQIANALYERLHNKINLKSKTEINKKRTEVFNFRSRYNATRFGFDYLYSQFVNSLEKLSLSLRQEAYNQINLIEKEEKKNA